MGLVRYLRGSDNWLSGSGFFWYLFLSLNIIGIFGVFSLDRYNVLPANLLFEILLASVSISLLAGLSRGAFKFVVASVLYILISGFLVVASGRVVGFSDFFIAYKSFFYVVLLGFFIGKDKLTSNNLLMIFLSCAFLFLLKYAAAKFLSSDILIANRPGIFYENNFELIFLLIIYLISSPHLGRYGWLAFLTVLTIVMLSGSRSSMLAFLVVSFVIYFKKFDVRMLLYLLILPAVVYFFYGIFQSRLSGAELEGIDRYNFLMIFFDEIKGWGVFNYLFGSWPMTPLSPASCNALSYYESLFGSVGDGTCYSVILHSFLLRILFDHGILGLIFLIAFVWYGLARVNYSVGYRLGVVGVLLASGLSVSSMNSVYTALALAIAFSSKQTSAVGIVCRS